MVSRGSDNEQIIKLEMTIDKAELERQLGTTFQGPAAGGAGAGVTARRKPSRVEPGPQMGKMLGKLAGLTGIAFTLNAILKQSKVISTTANAFNSIIGAILDSFLAPLIPLLIPVMEKLASLIQPAGALGSDVGGTIERAKAGDITFGKDTPERSLAKKFLEFQTAVNPITGPAYWGSKFLGSRMGNKEDGIAEKTPSVVVNVQGATLDQILGEIQDKVSSAFRDMSSKSFMGR